MRKAIFAAVVSTILMAGQANAALIKNGNVITDTASNLDWLQLTSSTGITYNQMLQNLSDAGSTFYGYQYATLDEVKTLFQNQGYAGNFYSSVSDQPSKTALSTIFANFGQTGTNASARGDGMYLNDNGGNVDWLFYVPASSTVRSLQNYINPNVAFWNGSNGNQMGSWLVKQHTAPVPEPETYAMLLAGLGLMAGIARRKEKQS